ncbi:MAG: phosphoribosylamine--glycine ligase [Acidimicrobiales bacterium]
MSPPRRSRRLPTACVVGSGAREHALALALARSADVVATPGNPGIAGISPEGHSLSSVDVPPEEIDADLFVIGPEAPLVEGLADRLRSRGGVVFGPGADGARIEGSKRFMKELCSAAGVETATWGSFDEPAGAVDFLRSLPGPYVVKADGLAAGKGVLVTSDLAEAEADAASKLSGAAFGDAGRRVVIEEGICGPELSLFCVCDGRRAVPLPPARDYKRVGTGDAGPNTGGMGALCPVPGVGEDLVSDILERIVLRTLFELGRRGVEYRGLLYAGLMLTDSGPKLIEFNARFGDPETEVVLPLLGGDLYELLSAAALGDLGGLESVGDFDAAVTGAAVCVVAASPGYPAAPVTGSPISGVEQAGSVEGVRVLHAGTRRNEAGALVTAGGRVLCVSGAASGLPAARSAAYAAIGRISFEGMQFRSDIAAAQAPAHTAELHR